MYNRIDKIGTSKKGFIIIEMINSLIASAILFILIISLYYYYKGEFIESKYLINIIVFVNIYFWISFLNNYFSNKVILLKRYLVYFFSSKEELKVYIRSNPDLNCQSCKIEGFGKIFGKNNPELYRYNYLGSVYLELEIHCPICNKVVNKSMIKGEESLDDLK